jgi:4-alpha-glucanotransferase
MEDLVELAERWGIFASYVDVEGQHRAAPPEAIRHIAAALAAAGPPVRPHAGIAASPAFQGDGKRGWILALQLYSVRSKRNWGHGDFTDLVGLINLVADMGAAGIGLNPLHALFSDRPEQASPYSPSSRLFLNTLYIDVEAIPEFSGVGSTTLADEIALLRDTALLSYRDVARIKLSALRETYFAFCADQRPERVQDLAAFRRERGRALAYFAAFEVLRCRFRTAWWDWPAEWQTPDDRVIERLRQEASEEFGFHEFLQWNADRQLAACQQAARRRALPVSLYVDVAVGVDAAGADVWMEQGAFLRRLSIGAPPDAFNPAGQDWGLTAYNPHRLAAMQFAPLRTLLQSSMRYAGAIRLDHVLGLMRLYVIPRGSSAAQGAYIEFPLLSMLSVVAEESRKQRCIVIGEDLGTVPEGFRATLAAWGIWSYLVMMFEREHDGSFRPPETYPEKALATFNTHDLPTFVGWMAGHDLDLKRSIAIAPGETDAERERSRQALRQALGSHACNFEAAVAYLAQAPARLVAIGIEDVLEVRDQINIPGTIEQHPNWRRRLPVSLEELAGDQRLARIKAIFDRSDRGSR